MTGVRRDLCANRPRTLGWLVSAIRAGAWLVVLPAAFWAAGSGSAMAQRTTSLFCPAFCSDGGCQTDCSPNGPLGPQVWCSPPAARWFARADAGVLTRDKTHTMPVAAVLPSRAVVLGSRDLDEPFRAAPRFLLGHRFGESPWQVDFSAFWVNDWDAGRAIRNHEENALGLDGNLVSPFTHFGQPAVVGYDYNALVSIREVSALENYELNVRYEVTRRGPTTALIFGVRHLGVRERFDYLSQSLAPAPVGSSVETSTRTTNELWGPQIGMQVDFRRQHAYWLHFETKWAVCNNHAVQTTAGTLNTGGVETPLGGTASRDTTAYVGDVELTLVWQIMPRLRTRVGYQFTWVGELAQAARNFAAPTEIMELGPAQVDTRGGAFYHGPHAGLELAW